jgi:UDP-N-acetylmuramate dehydrogenase
VAAGENALIILSVTFRLRRRPKVNLSYAELAEALEFDAGKGAKAGKQSGQASNAPSPTQVAAAVMAIRRNKLPDPYEYPNAGSFFKNPVIDGKTARRLETLSIEPYRFAEGYKVSAAQLIDLAGWKGTRSGDVGCWANQPLVLVNYGQATAKDLLSFAQEIQRSVAQRFEIQLELEPSVVS